MRESGAEPIVADGLDRAAVMSAVMRSEPDVVIHQMTGLAGVTSLRKFDAELAPTSRLRTEGTDNILEAARAAGARRVIAQSYGLWYYEGADDRLSVETDRLEPNPPGSMTQVVRAIHHVESGVTGAEGIDGLALRYGFFYGPGTGLAEDGSIVGLVRKRRFPIIGGGAGVVLPARGRRRLRDACSDRARGTRRVQRR